MNKYYEKNKFIKIMNENNYRVFYKYKISNSKDLDSFGIVFINNSDKNDMKEIIFEFNKYLKEFFIKSTYKNLPSFIRNELIKQENIFFLFKYKEFFNSINIEMHIAFKNINIKLKNSKFYFSFDYSINLKNELFFYGNHSVDTKLFIKKLINSSLYKQITIEPFKFTELELYDNFKTFEILTNSISISQIINY